MIIPRRGGSIARRDNTGGDILDIAWDAAANQVSRARAWFHRARARGVITGNLRGRAAKKVSFKTPKAIRTSAARSKRMPRARRRSRAAKRGRKRRRSRTRRKSVKRRKKARYSLSTRVMPYKKLMRFVYKGQLTVTPTDGAWGMFPFAANYMEQPMDFHPQSAATFQLLTAVSGSINRQPAGYDRWIDTGTSGEGKYSRYRVETSKVTLQHLPAALSDAGVEVVIGTGRMHGHAYSVGGLAEQYEGLDATTVAPLLIKPSAWKQVKLINSGRAGHVQTSTWSRKGQNALTHGSTTGETDKDWLYHNAAVDTSHFVPRNHSIGLAMLGPTGVVTPPAMNFICTIVYNCTLANPTNWDASVDDTGGVAS